MMQIGVTGSIPTASTVSLLKTANHLPELAGELIQKTLEGMVTPPAAPPTATAPPPSPGATEHSIDIFA
jgi:hypothetical protein